MKVLCRILGHRWSFPTPVRDALQDWVAGRETLGDTLQRACERCHIVQRFDSIGRWR
jgi:hypothetical protein